MDWRWIGVPLPTGERAVCEVNREFWSDLDEWSIEAVVGREVFFSFRTGCNTVKEWLDANGIQFRCAEISMRKGANLGYLYGYALQNEIDEALFMLNWR